MSCPICQSNNNEIIFNLNCGNIDSSTLYSTVRINFCRECGHLFNKLTTEELAGLIKYYNDEYAPANLGMVDEVSDRPGSNNKLANNRYEQLYKSIISYVNSDSSVLDVGCALGGFLDFLYEKGLTKLNGIDYSQAYVDNAESKKHLSIKKGEAESLPFNDQTFDLVVIEQVLEHLHDPSKAFREANRVLNDGGILCIGAPDASRYKDYPFFDFYWLLLREHIQHFDSLHLSMLGERNGFEFVNCSETTHAVMGNSMIMPNIYVIFRKTNEHKNLDSFAVQTLGNDRFEVKYRVEVYLTQEWDKKLAKKQKIESLIKSEQPIYIWGIGREFLYLYESLGLKECNIMGLIDSNAFKQNSTTVNGMKILNSIDILPTASEDSLLIITAVAHADSIHNHARKLGYKGQIIDIERNII